MNSAKEFINGSEDVTYSELYNKIINEELVPGSWYRLTDYKSVNFLNGWQTANQNPNPIVTSFKPRDVVMGDETEILLLQAISNYEISPIGYSETFSQDIVTYLPYVNKIGVNLSITNGSTMPDSSTVSGFDLQWDGTNVYFMMPTGYPAHYGHYFYLYCEFNDGVDSYYQDGTYEPLSPNGICQYPSTGNYNQEKTMSRIKLESGGAKVVLLDLVEADYDNYISNTLNVQHIQALNDAYGWVTRRQDTQNRIDVPFDFRWIKYRRYECEILGNITSISYNSTGTTASDNTYNNLSPNSDTSTDGENATFNVTVSGGTVTDVVIKNSGRLYANGDTLTIDGTQIGGLSGDDDVVITVNGIDSNIGYWGIGDVFNGANTTGSNNYIDSLSIDWRKWNIYNLEIDGQGGADTNYYNGFCENNVFLGNVSEGKIGNNFSTNTIGNYFNNNTIGNYFNNNTIGNGFQSNTIGNDFQNNTIGSNFYQNTIENNFNTNTIWDNFQNNTIGISFGNNTIGNNFSANTIGIGLGNNIIGINFQSNTIGDNFYQNTIGNDFQNNIIGFSFYQNTIGINFQSNTIGDSLANNTIGINFQSNTIGDSLANNTIGINFLTNTIENNFNTNTIGDNFNNNTIGISFGNNTIGINFQSNTIGDGFQSNTIGNSFSTNTIGNSFQTNTVDIDFQTNTVGINFNQNTVDNNFLNNTVGDSFFNNTVGNFFRQNTVGDSFVSNTVGDDFKSNQIYFSPTSTDFTLAIHVYADYTCTIFKRSDGTLRLSYIDGTDTIQYTAVNA
jgi:hypothetical protein